MPVNLWLVVLVVAVIAARRLISPLVGGVLGVLAAAGVGVWGWIAFEDGAGMAFLGMQITRPVFLVLIAIWALVEALGVWRFLRARQQTRVG